MKEPIEALLTDLLEYMEDKADADIEGGNKEMQFQIRIEEALRKLRIGDTDISKLKKGDKVRYVKAVKPIPKNFTLGKEYTILDVKTGFDWRIKKPYIISVNIRTDVDSSYWIPVSNTFRRWECA